MNLDHIKNNIKDAYGNETKYKIVHNMGMDKPII